MEGEDGAAILIGVDARRGCGEWEGWTVGADGNMQVIEAKTAKPVVGVEGEDARVDNRCVMYISLTPLTQWLLPWQHAPRRTHEGREDSKRGTGR